MKYFEAFLNSLTPILYMDEIISIRKDQEPSKKELPEQKCRGDEPSYRDNKKFKSDQRIERKDVDGNIVHPRWNFHSYTPFRTTKEAILMEVKC